MGFSPRRTAGGTTTLTLYDEAGRWIGDYQSNGTPIQQAVWFDDLPVGLIVGTGVNQQLHYIEADALGTPRVVIDPVRDVAVWNWDLAGDAFGDNAPNQDADGDGTPFVFDMRFPGQRYDAPSGLTYNYFRDYDTSTGRYAQSDSIGLDGGVGTFSYVQSNPLHFIDQYGLQQRPPIPYPQGAYYPSNPAAWQAVSGYYTSGQVKALQAAGKSVPSPFGCSQCDFMDRYFEFWGNVSMYASGEAAAGKLSAKLASCTISMERVRRVCMAAGFGATICSGNAENLFKLKELDDIVLHADTRAKMRTWSELSGQRRIGNQTQRPPP